MNAMDIHVGPPYAINLGLFYVCRFSTTVRLNDERKRFIEYYISEDESGIYSRRENKIQELIDGLNEKGIYPTITS